MTLNTYLSLQLLLIVGCVTPGPNNALLSSSGMQFGFRRTIPHILGVIFGHSFMEFGVALGLGTLYESFAIFRLLLQITAILLLLWFAYKIATAPVDEFEIAASNAKPWTFIQAFIFQWVNPKAWLICIAVSGQYAGGSQPITTAIYIFIACTFAGVISANTWTIFGVVMTKILNTPVKRRLFNWGLAALLLASVVMMLGDN